MSESAPGQSPKKMTGDMAAGLGSAAGTAGRSEAAPFEISQEPVTPEGELAAAAPAPKAVPAYEHLGELPATYHTQSVYLVAYDPKQLFAYWDVDWTVSPATPYALHVCRVDGTLEKKADIAAAEAGKYLPVDNLGGTYFVELGRYGRDGRWNVIATSSRVTMPPAGLAGETDPEFATLPFHLSFQRLLELIHDTVGQGEELTAALARIQRGDRAALESLAGTLSHLDPEPLQALEAILGQQPHVSSDSEESLPPGGRLHRDRHDVLAAGAFSSEGLSSANFGGSSLFGSQTLPGGGLSSEILGGGSETLAAYIAGLSSEAVSSFGGGFASEEFGGKAADWPAHERAALLLQVLVSQLGMLGGSSSESSGAGFGSSENSGR